MKKTLFLMSVLFAAACGGKSDSAKDPCKDKMAHMDCAGMADHVVESMKGSPDMPAEAVDEAHGVMVDQCTSMARSQETIDCMGMATTPESGEKCADMMTEEQRTSFMSAMNGGKEDGVGEDTDEGTDEGMDEEGMD